jgi:hypothetical protein
VVDATKLLGAEGTVELTKPGDLCVSIACGLSLVLPVSTLPYFSCMNMARIFAFWISSAEIGLLLFVDMLRTE